MLSPKFPEVGSGAAAISWGGSSVFGAPGWCWWSALQIRSDSYSSAHPWAGKSSWRNENVLSESRGRWEQLMIAYIHTVKTLVVFLPWDIQIGLFFLSPNDKWDQSTGSQLQGLFWCRYSCKASGSHLNRSSMCISKTIKPLNSAIICFFHSLCTHTHHQYYWKLLLLLKQGNLLYV